MTYGELLEKRKKLDSVNFIEKAHHSFVYAVARNKDKMDSIKKSLEKMIAYDTGYEDYLKALDEINRKYAVKDSDGTISFVTISTGKGVQRGYKKLVGEGNPDSPYEKDIKALKDKYKKEISEQEAKEKIYETRLDEEIPADDYRIFFIDHDIIPDGLHPVGMEGCLHFIKEPEEEKKEPEKKSKR